MTDAEGLLWSRLRARRLGGHRWRRQYAIGPYFGDFVCLDRRLVVEVDGSQHGERPEYDRRRDAWLRREGWRVLRVWNGAVFSDLSGACDWILSACEGSA